MRVTFGSVCLTQITVTVHLSNERTAFLPPDLSHLLGSLADGQEIFVLPSYNLIRFTHFLYLLTPPQKKVLRPLLFPAIATLHSLLMKVILYEVSYCLRLTKKISHWYMRVYVCNRYFIDIYTYVHYIQCLFLNVVI